MFWWAVIVGLKTLMYWETYAAVLEYLAIYFIAYYLLGSMINKNKEMRLITRRLSVLLIPLLNAAAMQLFVLTLSPIMFGIAGDAAWGYPLEMLTTSPGLFFTMTGVLLASAGIMTCIPFLKRLPAFHSFVLGVISLMFAFGIFVADNPGILKGPTAILPDIWFLTGLLVFGSIMTWAGRLAAAFAGTAFGIADEGTGRIILFPLSAIFGFLPVFVYGALLGIQLKGGI